MIFISLCSFFLLIMVLCFIRVAFILQSSNKVSEYKLPFCKTMVVVGSGGHTSEMMALLRNLSEKFTPRIYVFAESDSTSEKRIKIMEENRSKSSQHTVLRIKRSREVAQSWCSTIVTTIVACYHAVFIIWRQQPDLLLCNGPGTCIPLCGAVFLLKICFIVKTKIVFVESICRVKTLSLSGKILYLFADRVLVQWPELSVAYPKSEFIGRLV
ncbi:UDP-N-acetylglucosamine transferase subunit ALG14 homolog isoform X1 [Hydractinia symbiolongicarpus]|uniref:UDP-N-acetylglucosamine transferase subunit ALG14 homolog isoform X1 n=2 Tax=Hydractinia symbiolongicarpus TaxID=13093 RepID=UPI00254A9CAD|nr:UDP-N-acetylglucosamine transferase subunit ALG14 homolog isoform X1 [Hydractinia symbiolongicarpus]